MQHYLLILINTMLFVIVYSIFNSIIIATIITEIKNKCLKIGLFFHHDVKNRNTKTVLPT